MNHDDAERDAWLRAALRHAPDADLPVPRALGDAILREAEAKARARVAVDSSRGSRLWRWLATPVAAAAFASVIVATAVGLLWWDRPLSEQGPREVAALPAPTAQVAESAQSTTATPEPAPALPSPRAMVRREAVAPPAPLADATRKAAKGSDAPTPSMPPAAPMAAPAAAPALSGLTAKRADAVAAVSLAELRTSVAVDVGHWSWQRGGGAAQPVGDAITAWLVQADSAAGGRWRPESTEPEAPQDVLRLFHDGRPVHRLWLDGRTLRWESMRRAGVPPQRWDAALDAAAAQALRQALDEATR